MRALCLRILRSLAQRRVERCTDVVNENASTFGQQARSGHQSEGVFFFAQMAHHQGSQVAVLFLQVVRLLPTQLQVQLRSSPLTY
jgi:hypothetical protein